MKFTLHQMDILDLEELDVFNVSEELGSEVQNVWNSPKMILLIY
jgi:hypothetical protein